MHRTPVIQLHQLTKNFGELCAVDKLSLEVFEGDIFGFLGPNGAGKSTTIRIMLSLVKPSHGTVSVFGKELNQNRHEILQRIGCIVEDPDFYLYLSGEKNLELFGKLSGKQPEKKKIYELMELVGLKGREQDKVRTYSHGMKQRLGIAQTLIHDPDLIILDEPTTGLDPRGIIDVRNLILHLKNDLGKTIFLSSHLLHEVEQLATRMAIIHKGKSVVEGNVSELLSAHDLIVSVEVRDEEKIKSVIANSGWQPKLKSSVNSHFDFNISKNEIPMLNKFLSERGIEIFKMEYKRTLENYFLKLTSEN
jgi:ABC-2 type transport system ATP-binding protein